MCLLEMGALLQPLCTMDATLSANQNGVQALYYSSYWKDAVYISFAVPAS